jgi:hypothetical protein
MFLDHNVSPSATVALENTDKKLYMTNMLVLLILVTTRAQNEKRD